MLNIGQYTSDAPSLKRPRDMGEAPNPSEGLTVSDGSEASPGVRPDAGTSRKNPLSVTQQIQALEFSVRKTDHLFSLPLHTADLGRLPIYGSFDYNFTFQPNDIRSQSSFHMDSQYDQLEPIEPEFRIDAFEAPSATGHSPLGFGISERTLTFLMQVQKSPHRSVERRPAERRYRWTPHSIFHQALSA
ncbi:hypothetical protein B0H17DRAFT_1140783 [Mycena rosella]|uniref:Uncharacterized protein n=1 Tax=Mycena rosella TaxID=1033263 RepID=A0AAD7D189_MYCRO|nr:hypothetical protein B0H17DRAFT_1140783 [Mycena rosella]